MKIGRLRRLLLFWFALSAMIKVCAQPNIPLGTWRLHLSYSDLNALVLASDRVYAASDIGIMIFDKVDQQINTISKIDGLSSARITAIAYDQQHETLVIAHENGLVSFLAGNTITSFNSLVVSSAISGSRKINHITIEGALAYLSTDFGVVVFDLDKKEVKETYRDLSDSGEALKINQSVVFQDSLFLATEVGVITGSLKGTSNLLDFRNWNRYNQGVFDDNIESIVVFNGAVYSAINFQGIYQLQNGQWILQSYLQNEDYRKLSSTTANLIITTTSKVGFTDGVTLTDLSSSMIVNPDDAIQDVDGTIWIADGENGLVSHSTGNVINYKPNGPSSNLPWRVTFSKDRIIYSKGGFSSTLNPLNRTFSVDQFVSGQWSVLPTSQKIDITDQAQTFNASYFSSFGFGLERISEEGTQLFDDSNSPLKKGNPPNPFILVPSIEPSSTGIWITNYGVTTPLHFLSDDLIWESFSFTQPQAVFPVELLVDILDQIWMVIDPSKGGGIIVFNKLTGQSVHLTSQAGKGGLPSSIVRSIANDRDGQVWVGTDEGVVYYPNPGNAFSASVDAVRPIFENRFLLRDESISAIAIDGGNRKWFGTTNGVWLFDPTGESFIYNFTEENDPLLSSKIVSIAIDPKSGEVFFATDKGTASFRSTATESTLLFSDVKIFPNPVTADFSGQVAINGLYTDAIVKITDIGGRLVWQTRANGGTATWNARQLNGNRVSTGMYLVFATSEDGSERHVGKIAVIQ